MAAISEAELMYLLLQAAELYPKGISFLSALNTNNVVTSSGNFRYDKNLNVIWNVSSQGEIGWVWNNGVFAEILSAKQEPIEQKDLFLLFN